MKAMVANSNNPPVCHLAYTRSCTIYGNEWGNRLINEAAFRIGVNLFDGSVLLYTTCQTSLLHQTKANDSSFQSRSF
jgi:hypothetical protein